MTRKEKKVAENIFFVVILIVSIIIISVLLIISHKRSNEEKAFNDNLSKLESQLEIKWFNFIKEDPTKVFVRDENLYRYATSEEKELMLQFYNLLNEEQKQRFHVWLFISEQSAERLFFAQTIGVSYFKLQPNGLSARVTDWNNVPRDATLEELMKIKEFEELH